MDIKTMIKEMYNQLNSSYLKDHERDYVEKMYTKLVYANRPAEGSDTKTVKRLYQIYLSRKTGNA